MSQVLYFANAMVAASSPNSSSLSGAYAVIFGFALWVLPRKFNVPAVKIFFFPAIIALFFSATLSIAFDLLIAINDIMALNAVNENSRLIVAAVFIAYMLFGDFGKNSSSPYSQFYLLQKVLTQISTPVGSFNLLSLSLTAVVLALEIIVVKTSIQTIYALPHKPSQIIAPDRVFIDIFVFINAFGNILMTAMIAGRVWWISRTHAIKHYWYQRTVAIIVWNYLSSLPDIKWSNSINLTSLEVPSPTTVGVIAMGLAPTLIAVRVGSGSAYDHQSSRLVQISDILLSTDIGVGPQHFRNEHGQSLAQ
ncbi:hypothetical protein D9757_008642 [Collybiopsis confluens]|uniref:Uncharacterized protein n=1 Tax=Collybiopsis confluens TaxID=2823264 RepID=A0A8H5H447_9AGAR|nr:hypothetical protein D9757_008642 [Collybiopsis confluens]